MRQSPTPTPGPAPQNPTSGPTPAARKTSTPSAAPAAGDEYDLTTRQRAILSILREHHRAGRPIPSVRDLARTVGLKSPSAVSYQLTQLEAKGFIRRGAGHRTVTVLDTPAETRQRGTRIPPHLAQYRPFFAPHAGAITLAHVRSAAAVARQYLAAHGEEMPAGLIPDLPILAHFLIYPSYTPIPHDFAGGLARSWAPMYPGDTAIMDDATPKVMTAITSDDGMHDAGILDGDLVVVAWGNEPEPGGLVYVILDGDATEASAVVREFHEDSTGTWFLPSNEDYSPVSDTGAIILGTVHASMRGY